MKKPIFKFILIIVLFFILIIISKIYNFIILNKVYNAIEEFIKNENRYYSVTRKSNGELIETDYEILKDDIGKYFIDNNDFEKYYYEIKDYKNDKQYCINTKQNQVKLDTNLTIDVKSSLLNLPRIILDIFYKGDKISFSNFLSVKYILPIKYNNKLHYKVAVNRKYLIISSENFLPVYEYRKIANSTNDSNKFIEYIYQFKTDIVTDEDVSIPDLTDFTIIK